MVWYFIWSFYTACRLLFLIFVNHKFGNLIIKFLWKHFVIVRKFNDLLSSMRWHLWWKRSEKIRWDTSVETYVCSFTVWKSLSLLLGKHWTFVQYFIKDNIGETSSLQISVKIDPNMCQNFHGTEPATIADVLFQLHFYFTIWASFLRGLKR